MRTYILSLIIFMGCAYSLSSQSVSKSVLHKTAPDSFRVEFQTTQGSFTVEAYRNWSPEGVDRLYQLVMTDFYDSAAIFRVQPDYVVQFGISPFPNVNDFWDRHPLEDEPVKVSNKNGRISYAREGPLSRTTQLFINCNDNPKLDTVQFNNLRGFAPVAQIVDGFEVIKSFYSEYGFEPANKQDSVYKLGNVYLKKHYPELDYILKTKMIKEK